MKVRWAVAVLFLVGLFTAGSSAAQFVTLSRCRAALPCAVPFGLRYRPDPLIAGHYGSVGNTVISGGVRLETPLKPELDKRVEAKRAEVDVEAVDAAVKESLRLHPSKAGARRPEQPRREPAAAGKPEREPPR